MSLAIVTGMQMRIELMTANNWPSVRAIYEEGLATGIGSFEVSSSEWAQWNVARLPHSRFVARDDDGAAAGARGNEVGRTLQASCGFRVVGHRERIAQRDGVWHDTILTERRSRKAG